ncbi:MAG: type II toxin-antitoxin system RelE/ParE family toxin [Eggerthellaceae bacterium]|jgi:putative addiction module killer protein|nr:type II toxin-antitoxin system RelE/ParE family toxin [Eggerthellaceae bacterium]MDR2716342.1 type II toxin-antitoxin system RelE/ParE family toxin [Coriobacteriaceae bacterium]
MKIIRSTHFDRWLKKLANGLDKARILRRLERIGETGDLGDWSSVGDGIFELRFFFGLGYRVYFTRRGESVIVLLVGGDKDTHERDIEKAKQIAKEYGNGD